MFGLEKRHEKKSPPSWNSIADGGTHSCRFYARTPTISPVKIAYDMARDVFASGMVPDEPPRANPYRKLKQKIKEQKSSSLSKLLFG